MPHPGTKKICMKKQSEIVDLLCSGTATQQVIADQTGVTRASVTSLNRRHRSIIEKAHAELIEGVVPIAVNRTLSEVTTAAFLHDVLLGKETNNTKFESTTEISEYLKRVDKKEEMIMKSVGIAPSNAPSIYVQNIFNDNRGSILSPVVGQLLSGKLAEMTADIEDADFEDIEDG